MSTTTQERTEVQQLTVEDLSISFGGVKPLDGVSFTVAPGSLTAIIGPNGAGKTSLFNCLSGIYRPTSGTIRFGGDRVDLQKPYRIAALGIGRTFQTPALFEGLTVEENLRQARYLAGTGGVVRGALRTIGLRRDERVQAAAVDEIVELMDLDDIRGAAVTELAYGVMKRVELARALCQSPRLLLLDEPMAGMTYEEKIDMSRCIATARERFEMSVLLIEHDMGVVMEIAEHVVVLDFGRKISDGTPAEVQRDPAVVSAYLGEADEDA